jgi:hypothetical protein
VGAHAAPPQHPAVDVTLPPKLTTVMGWPASSFWIRRAMRGPPGAVTPRRAGLALFTTLRCSQLMTA